MSRFSQFSIVLILIFTVSTFVASDDEYAIYDEDENAPTFTNTTDYSDYNYTNNILFEFDEFTNATTDFDPSSRGHLKFGDKCEMTQQCGFAGSICYQSSCTCSHEYMSTNHVDKCGKAASVNESCFFNGQCEDSVPETECRDGRCICRFDKTPITRKDGSIECVEPLEDEVRSDGETMKPVKLVAVFISSMVAFHLGLHL